MTVQQVSNMSMSTITSHDAKVDMHIFDVGECLARGRVLTGHPMMPKFSWTYSMLRPALRSVLRVAEYQRYWSYDTMPSAWSNSR